MITNSEIFFFNITLVVSYAFICKRPKFFQRGHFYIAVSWSITLVYLYYVVLEIDQNMRPALGKWGLLNPLLFILIYLIIDGVAQRSLTRKTIIESIVLLYKNNFKLKDWIAVATFSIVGILVNYYFASKVYDGHYFFR